MKSFDWYAQSDSSGHGGWVVKTLVQIAVGVIMGFLFWYLGRRALPIVIWSITGIFGAISLVWEKGRIGLKNCFAVFGQWVGTLVTIVLLSPIHFVLLTIVRVYRRIMHRDPLQLRDSDKLSFWCVSDTDRRKVRYIGASFAPEVVIRSRRSWMGIAIIIITMVVASELMLRVFGFGKPILYISHPTIGYYPAPNQDVFRYGGTTATNSFGMRRSEISAVKPEGYLRIMMIGDSTIWGGSYMNQDEIYPPLLEKALNQASMGPQVQVLNVGANGWGAFHEIGYVKEFGTFDSDIAVICLPIGDIYRLWSSLATSAYFEESAPPRCAIEEIASHLMWRYRFTRGRRRTTDRSRIHRQRRAEMGIQAYVELAKELNDRGCEVLVEILPSRDAGISGVVTEEEQDAIDRLSRRLRDEGFKVAYPVGIFKDKGPPEELYHDVVHLDKQGHRLYAAYLKDRLMSVSESLRAWHDGTTVSQDNRIGAIK